MNVLSKHKSNPITAPRIESVLAIDLWPLSKKNLGENNRIIWIVDEKFGYIFTVGLESKKVDNVNEGILGIILEISSYVHLTRVILFDNEQIFDVERNLSK